MCLFCDLINDKSCIIDENTLAYTIYDSYPVSQGHVLIIPKRHVSSFFELDSDETKAVFDLVRKMRDVIEKKYAPHGYNIGVNVDEAAGQTIMHCHIHLIPRYQGDVENPRGGVRGVIPSKKDY